MSILRRFACAVALTMGAAGIASAQHSTAPVIELTARGEIQIAPDGHVSDYELKTKLAPSVAQALDRAVRGWRFEPVLVDGRAVAAKTTMIPKPTWRSHFSALSRMSRTDAASCTDGTTATAEST